MNAGGPLLKSCFGPLARYGTHQEIMSARLEQVYLLSDSRFDLPGEGHYSSWILINCGRGGQNMGTIQVTPWTNVYVRPGALGQIWHWCKSLSNVAENLYQIC